MTGYRVLATLTLTPIADGGLSAPLPAGTRSLLLRFPAFGEGQSSPVSLGAVLTPLDAAALRAGEKLDAEALFWADDARIYARPGAVFELWYGRLVGSGTVTSVIEEES